MEMGALMTVVKRRIHNWHVAGSRRGYLQRKLTTLNVSATGLKNVEDAAFIHHIQKPVNSGESRNQNWWHLNFFWGYRALVEHQRPKHQHLHLLVKLVASIIRLSLILNLCVTRLVVG